MSSFFDSIDEEFINGGKGVATGAGINHRRQQSGSNPTTLAASGRGRSSAIKKPKVKTVQVPGSPSSEEGIRQNDSPLAEESKGQKKAWEDETQSVSVASKEDELKKQIETLRKEMEQMKREKALKTKEGVVIEATKAGTGGSDNVSVLTDEFSNGHEKGGFKSVLVAEDSAKKEGNDITRYAVSTAKNGENLTKFQNRLKLGIPVFRVDEQDTVKIKCRVLYKLESDEDYIIRSRYPNFGEEGYKIAYTLKRKELVIDCKKLKAVKAASVEDEYGDTLYFVRLIMRTGDTMTFRAEDEHNRDFLVEGFGQMQQHFAKSFIMDF